MPVDDPPAYRQTCKINATLLLFDPDAREARQVTARMYPETQKPFIEDPMKGFIALSHDTAISTVRKTRTL
jgi:hypothetical protein